MGRDACTEIEAHAAGKRGKEKKKRKKKTKRGSPARPHALYCITLPRTVPSSLHSTYAVVFRTVVREREWCLVSAQGPRWESKASATTASPSLHQKSASMRLAGPVLVARLRLAALAIVCHPFSRRCRVPRPEAFLSPTSTGALVSRSRCEVLFPPYLDACTCTRTCVCSTSCRSFVVSWCEGGRGEGGKESLGLRGRTSLGR